MNLEFFKHYIPFENDCYLLKLSLLSTSYDILRARFVIFALSIRKKELHSSSSIPLNTSFQFLRI